ncbi:hypothetical protein HOR87_gp32 [Marinomonas phage CB5A]|uniref:Uncharacterized protein n=1 Tax=Marinomonas phage CB5A TaxID=2022859 RepID=A0A222G3V1_9CAUD|nr:hypothetical protein HOR87_gp32 [Marinomonas phage CB5A]ASP46263.1 hypothetical protein [Marinomonas phage CB5A]
MSNRFTTNIVTRDKRTPSSTDMFNREEVIRMLKDKLRKEEMDSDYSTLHYNSTIRSLIEKWESYVC